MIPSLDAEWFRNEQEDFAQRAVYLAEEDRLTAAEVARCAALLCALGAVLVRIAEGQEELLAGLKEESR